MTAGWKGLLGLGGGLVVSGMVGAEAAIAADDVVLTYGLFTIAVPVAELETFAETGETSDDLEQLLRLAGQSPATFRTALTRPLEISPTALDVALNNPLGDWLLDGVSETIQPAAGQAGRQALRAALVGASSDDNQITLLEVMQEYPSAEIVVNGDRLIETYNRLYEVLEPFEDLAEILIDMQRQQQ